MVYKINLITIIIIMTKKYQTFTITGFIVIVADDDLLKLNKLF